MKRRCVYLVLTAVLSTPYFSEAADWPQFRGLHRDGKSAEQGLLDSWGEDGPKEVWRHKLGHGFSCFSIVDGRIFTLFATSDENQPTEFAAAFDAATGKELWRTALSERFDEEFGNGPRSTPTVHGDSLYVISSRGRLAALKIADGTEQWSVEMTEVFGVDVPRYGFSISPLIDGYQLIVEGGGKEGKAYAAFAIKTGKLLWSSGDGRGEAGYSSAISMTVGKTSGYISVAGQKLIFFDTGGKELWSREWPRGETHSMPVFVAPDMIFASGAGKIGGVLLKLISAGGEITAEEIWTTKVMRNHFSSSLVHEEHIYGFDNASLKSISNADGAVLWSKRGLGKGSLIYADGKLLVFSDRGKLVLVDATETGYVEKGSIQALSGKCWTAPALADGKLYLRNHEEMVCYDISNG